MRVSKALIINIKIVAECDHAQEINSIPKELVFIDIKNDWQRKFKLDLQNIIKEEILGNWLVSETRELWVLLKRFHFKSDIKEVDMMSDN